MSKPPPTSKWPIAVNGTVETKSSVTGQSTGRGGRPSLVMSVIVPHGGSGKLVEKHSTPPTSTCAAPQQIGSPIVIEAGPVNGLKISLLPVPENIETLKLSPEKLADVST